MESSITASSPFDTHRARVILGVVVAFTLTSTVSLILRFVGKSIKKRAVSREDWFIIAAQVAVYGLAAATILEVVLGNAGHHAVEAPEKIPVALKLLVALQCLYAVALGLIKISICLFCSRIFAFKSFRIASWTIIAVAVAWTVATVLNALLACRPLAFFWNPTIPGGSCANPVVPFIILGVLDIIIDLAILVLPLPMLWKLQVALPDKIALFCIFGAGICTMVISILSMEAIVNLSFDDVTYTGTYALVWSFAEPSIGISVACAPFFRPLWRRTFRNSDIELGQASPRFRRLRHTSDSLPSFVNPNIKVAKGIGQGGSFVTTQFSESGHWSTASQQGG